MTRHRDRERKREKKEKERERGKKRERGNERERERVRERLRISVCVFKAQVEWKENHLLYTLIMQTLNTILRVPPSLTRFPSFHQKTPGGCNRTWRRILKGSEHTAAGDPAAKLCRKPLNICKCKKCEKFILMIEFW